MTWFKDFMEKVDIINIVQRVNDLEKRVDDNVKAITSIYADINDNILPHIKDIDFNLTNNIAPDMEKLHGNVSRLYNDITTIHKNLQANIIPAIDKAMNQATNAMEEAMSSATVAGLAENAASTAAAMSQNIFDTFKSVSDGVTADVENVIEKERQLMNTIRVETEETKVAFIDFGQRLDREADDIGEGMLMVVKQLNDAVNEIQIPLDKTVYHAKKIVKPSALTLGKVARSIGHAIKAFSYLTWRGYGGQSSVLLEELEAFNQISSAFRRLSSDFKDFGILIRYSAQNLSRQISSSALNIKIAFAEFMSAFENLFINMGFSMKGAAEDTAELLRRKQELDAEKEAQFIAWKTEAIEEQRASDYAFLQEMNAACVHEQARLADAESVYNTKNNELIVKERELLYTRRRITDIEAVLG